MHTFCRTQKGFSLVELIVTSALIFLMFGGLIGIVQTSLVLLGVSKAETSALAVANDRLEYVRSLQYDAIGTVAGVPAGLLPQTRTVTANNTTYTERLLIQYIDSPADGTGGGDTNGIVADYKQIKVEYTWTLRGQSHSLYLTSDVIPRGIESTAGGGTIRVNVFDAAAQPISGAGVRFVNASLAPTIDTTRYTDATGVAYLSGAPAGAGYEIFVSKPGYTTDSTYVADAGVVSPNTPPVAVIVSQVSTMNFQIDRISSLTIETKAPPTTGTIGETYNDMSGISTSSSVASVGGRLVLTNTAGTYAPSGFAVHASATPATFLAWSDAAFSATTPAGTSVRLSFYYVSGGTLQLVPDAILPGNSAGIAASPIDLSALSGPAYNTLVTRATLATTDSATTSALGELVLTYTESQSSIGNVTLAVSGQKSLGTDGSSQPVLRYDEATTTNGSGVRTLSNMIWDAYTVDIIDPAYTIVAQCPNSPFSLYPNTNATIDIELISAVAYALRVVVTDGSGTPIPDATVQVDNGGYSATAPSSLCGQAAFTAGLFSSAGYTVTVSKAGYATEVITNVSVTDDQPVQSVILH